MSKSLTEVRLAWEADADRALVERVNALIADGQAAWTWDPWLDGVAGVVWTGTNKALVVVYADGDWEHDVNLSMPGNKFIESGLERVEEPPTTD